MSHPPESDFKHFTAFRSAAEEAAAATRNERSQDEPGHGAALAGRIVQTPGEDQPYKVILEHADGPCSEHACATIKEGEAIIRQCTPASPARGTSRDRARF